MADSTQSAFVRFEHVNMACKNLDALKTFYGTVFPEWRVRAEGKNEAGHRWMHFGNDRFYVALSEETSFTRVHQLYRNLGICHVGFVITNGDAMKARLDQNLSITHWSRPRPNIAFTSPTPKETKRNWSSTIPSMR